MTSPTIELLEKLASYGAVYMPGNEEYIPRIIIADGEAIVEITTNDTLFSVSWGNDAEQERYTTVESANVDEIVNDIVDILG